jgi:Predicted transcriptional regulators
MNNVNMAHQLVELRESKGVTQETLAAAVGLSNKTVSKWETGASLPDAECIPAIADFYGVSIDSLYGRGNAKSDEVTNIMKEYAGLSMHDGVVKSFDLALQVVRGCISTFTLKNYDEDVKDRSKNAVPRHILEGDDYCRTTLKSPLAYETLINSGDNNMAVMLLGNENNFSWMDEKIDIYIELFRFLSDKNAVKLVKLIHDEDFPISFTCDFFAKQAGIDEDTAAAILEKGVELQLCRKIHRIHLKDKGTVDVFDSLADGENGLLLTILALAYEFTAGEDNVHTAFNSPLKMIRGTKNEEVAK